MAAGLGGLRYKDLRYDKLGIDGSNRGGRATIELETLENDSKSLMTNLPLLERRRLLASQIFRVMKLRQFAVHTAVSEAHPSLPNRLNSPFLASASIGGCVRQVDRFHSL